MRNRQSEDKSSVKYPYKVALLTNFIPPYRLPLFRALQGRLWQFRVFLSTPMEPNRPWPADWRGLDVVVQRSLTLRRTWRHPRGFSEPLYVHVPYDTLPLLKRYQPDVVISAELGLRSAQAVLYRKLHPRSRVIAWATLSEQTEQGRGKLRTCLRRWLLPQLDAVLVNGESGARYIRRFGVHEGRVFRVPQTTAIPAFCSVPLERDPSLADRLLYVGRLIELKGLAPFLKVLCRWAERHPERNLEFWAVGDGPLRGTLEQLAYPPNLSTRFWGHVAYQDLPQVYAQGSILVFPTLADEWGLVVNEAMAAGLLVLGSLYSQAVEELVREGENGWLFRPDSSEEAYAALDRALNTSPALLQEMRANARRTAQTISLDVVADRILRAIEWCVEHPVRG